MARSPSWLFFLLLQMSLFWLVSAVSALYFGTLQVSAFDNSRSDNLAVYWGQNSYGATHLSDPANWQHNIGYYCQDDSIDAIPIAFLNVFQTTGGLPSINLANICNVDDNGVFPGTAMPNCTFLQSDIEYCQSRGKIVTISLGGATGAATFTSSQQAIAFGDTIWNMFLGGNDAVRPFGGAVLDGIDLDIEGGTTLYFDSFINRIRELASTASNSKKYYVTAAPQCPYPDAYLGTVLNLVAFDAVYVQFYNNWCGLQNYNNIWAWDFSSWDTWAKTLSVNPNVKIYIGAPASPTAAGTGYVDASTLANIALETRSDYSSFGGVMLWDASQAYANNRYDAQIKNAIRIGSGGSSSSSVVTVSTSTRSSTSTSRASTSTSASRSSTTTGSATRTSSSSTATRTSSTGTSTRTTGSGTSTRTSSTATSTSRGSTTSTRSSTTTARSSTSTRASSTSTRASTTTGATGTNTRTSATSTRTSTTSIRTSTTTSRATTTSRTGTSTSATSTSRSGSGTGTSSSSSPTSTDSTGGACAGVNAWRTDTVYVGGDQVSYNGDLWTAKWWSYNDVPGGPAGVWADNGPC
ncbi:glycoside hydrolase [Trametes cingulata]|nr:glycoside hydrolase [Trametes cingulata]